MSWSDHHHVLDLKIRNEGGRVQWRAACTCGNWVWGWAGIEQLPDPEHPQFAEAQLAALFHEHYDSCYE